jgi:hypothetical protein
MIARAQFFQANVKMTYALHSNHDDCLETEFSIADFVEQVFQRVSKSLHNHDVEVPFDDCSLQFWDSLSLEEFEQFSLMKNLGMSGSI